MEPMRKAVLVDALGTILWMDAPWNHAPPRLTDGLDQAQIEAAFVAEISYYRAHIADGRDAEGLADLRRRCARILGEGLGREVSVAEMMSTLRFEPFDETREALGVLGRRGMRLACVSNWDCSLPDVLAELGLASSFELVVTSASAGAAKPDPAIFEAALSELGCEASEVLHVGDSPEDVTGARAAGIEVLLLDRSGNGDIRSLVEIIEYL